MAVKRIVRDPEGRLRSGWRVLLQFVGFVLLLIVVQGLQGAAQERRSAPLYGVGSGVYLLGQVCLFWGLARWVDRRRFVDYGLHLNPEWWLDLAAGLAIGAFTLSAVAAVEWGVGWARFSLDPRTVFEGPFVLAGAGALLNSVAVGAGEEMTFRGYQVRNLAEGIRGLLGPRGAVAVTWMLTSALFGAVHLMNPNVTVMGALNVALAGMLLGWGYVVTGELALPIGLHVAWGFFEEFVYGFANSGQTPLSRLIGSEVTGPGLWTGGEFGPEAGLLVTLLVVVDALLIVAWVRFRRRWQGIRVELATYDRAW
jgi:membrane protease YdiL (CAAX protease family)